MIPLRDNVPSQTVPFVTYGLIAVNAAAFLLTRNLGSAAEPFLYQYGFIPVRLWTEGLAQVGPSLLTSQFLHGGWLHLLSNLWYLWIFGDNVEDRLGHGRFLFFYLACGVAAGLAQAWNHPGQPIPTIGASGAIAGVLGAYFILYPTARILTLVPVIIFLEFIQLPAFFFLAFWFVQQYLMGLMATGMTGQSGVAWWAHIGGFLAGIGLVLVLQRRDRRPRTSDYWPRRHRGYIRFD